MPYKLLLSEEITPAVRRMIVEQLSRARRELSSAQNIQDGVHKSRTCLKRVRSLLRLARPILGEEIFQSENRSYRDLARALSQPREAGALLETIVKFEGRDDFKHYAPLLLKLKKYTLKKKLSSEIELEIISLSALVETLDASIIRWKKMPLQKASFKNLAHGFGQTYERGLDSLKIALKNNDSFYLHEWRKDVQQTWRHMQVLTLIWPEDIMPRIKLAREISRLLGTEHDIADLHDFMKLKKAKLYKSSEIKTLYKPFRDATKTIRRDLCLHAIERGRRLYAFEAQAISDAMTVYWRTSKAMQPMPSVVLELAQIGVAKNAALVKLRAARDNRTTLSGAKSGRTNSEKTNSEKSNSKKAKPEKTGSEKASKQRPRSETEE